MKSNESLYFEFKKLMFAAKETLLDENGAQKKMKDIPKKDLDELFLKSIRLMLKIAKHRRLS